MSGWTSLHPVGSRIVTLPLRTVSESNGREHWAKKAKRVKSHRTAAAFAARALLVRPLPAIVLLVRVAPRALDDDNLRGALKAVRDGIADAFEIDDRDPRVTWEYAQRMGLPGLYQVEMGVRAQTLLKATQGATSGH